MKNVAHLLPALDCLLGGLFVGHGMVETALSYGNILLGGRVALQKLLIDTSRLLGFGRPFHKIGIGLRRRMVAPGVAILNERAIVADGSGKSLERIALHELTVDFAEARLHLLELDGIEVFPFTL